MAKRPSRLGGNPLDALSEPAKDTGQDADQGKRARTPAERPKTAKLTVTLDQELYDRARGAADALSGPPERLTLAELVRRGVTQVVKDLEKRHHGGEPFPAPEGDLRRGRRPGS